MDLWIINSKSASKWLNKDRVEIKPSNTYSFVSPITWNQFRKGNSIHLATAVWKSSSDQIRSVAQSCLTLCDPMNRSMPGLPVHHQLLIHTQSAESRESTSLQRSFLISVFLLSLHLVVAIVFFTSQNSVWRVFTLVHFRKYIELCFLHTWWTGITQFLFYKEDDYASFAGKNLPEKLLKE